MFVDIDGTLKPRRGYARVHPAGVDERVIGGLNFAQSNSSRQTIVATLTGFWIDTGAQWQQLSPGPGRNASADAPVRIIPYFGNGAMHAVSCDFNDQLADWDGNSPVYTILTNSPVSRDVAALNERVVCAYTIEAGAPFPRRVRWSALLDQTTWPTLGFLDLSDRDDPIVSIRPLGLTQAAVYGEKSIYILSASPGDDANAFVAQEIFSAYGYPGPISTAAVTAVGGLHYYMAQDARIYTFDGINAPQPISTAIDALLQPLVAVSFGTRCHSSYLPSLQYVVFYFPGSGSQDCNYAAAFHLPTGRWEPLWNFANDFVTCSFSAINETTLTWQNDPYTWQTSPYVWNSIPDTQSLGISIGTTDGEISNFFVGSVDDNAPIAFDAYGPLISLGPNKVELVDRLELYTPQSASAEFVTIAFEGFGSPYSMPTPILALAQDLSSSQWLNRQAPPGPLASANIMVNYLRLGIFSTGAPSFAMGGGTVWLNTDDRFDYGSE